MKQKLTVTVDADLLPVAKRYARSRGVSLSSLVEQSLREMAGEYDALAVLFRAVARQVSGGGARDDFIVIRAIRYALADKYLR